MKKINFLLVAVALLVSTVVSATGLSEKFDNYKIKEVSSENIAKAVDASWTISYDEQKEPVLIEKHEIRKGFEYVVSSKYFQISYVVSKKGFGAQETRSAWSNVPHEVTSVVLNYDELSRQRIISPNEVDDEKALGLIAYYLPKLINDNYKNVLVK